RRIVRLVHRGVGNEDRAGGRGEDIGGPVCRSQYLRIPADNEAVVRQGGAVRTNRPCILCAEGQCGVRRQQCPAPMQALVSSYNHLVLLLWVLAFVANFKVTWTQRHSKENQAKKESNGNYSVPHSRPSRNRNITFERHLIERM